MIWDTTQQILTLLGVLVTAAATFALWRATRVLAVETQRLAKAGSQPQIVVSIESNQWSYVHADLRVANTGNSTAFDIHIEIEPPLVINLETGAEVSQTPLQNISLLKPGQEMASWVGKMFSFLDQVFRISISYSSQPGGEKETSVYTLDMTCYSGIHRLGSGDPLIQIADHVKKIQQDLRKVTSGSKNLSVDVFSSTDRDVEQRRLREFFDQQRATAKENSDATDSNE